PRAQQRELRLDVGEVRREQKQTEEEDVVERDAGRLDLTPRKQRRRPDHPGETRGRGHRNRGRDRPSPDVRVVLDDEDPDAGRQQEDAEVEQRSDLDPDGDELATGDAAEEGSLLAREYPLSPQPGDPCHHVRVHGTMMRDRRGWTKKSRAPYSSDRGIGVATTDCVATTRDTTFLESSASLSKGWSAPKATISWPGCRGVEVDDTRRWLLGKPRAKIRLVRRLVTGIAALERPPVSSGEPFAVLVRDGLADL